ncbi:hypothetical protein OSB04_025428 [Centaurea solstitialis]|uniref:Uncharacterized protein n=1 Tax=Centaurea solstitialis TaxID=347529 RepID=A0AA38WES8_9ASTR|nr:hypothetical protein OSB04_025428 [Centaurea solstitialis]
MICTKPDIAYVVGRLSTLTSKPRKTLGCCTSCTQVLEENHGLWFGIQWISLSIGRIHLCNVFGIKEVKLHNKLYHERAEFVVLAYCSKELEWLV